MSGKVVLCAWCGNEGKWSRNGRGGSYTCGRCRSKIARRLDTRESDRLNGYSEQARREDEELKK